MTPLLSNFRIGTKIYAGFGMLIALLIGIVFLANANLFNTKTTFIQYRALARETNLIGELQANVLMTRLGVKNFIINGDEHSIQTVQERLAQSKEFQEHGAREITNPVRMERMTQIGSSLDTYEASFKEVIVLQAKRHEAVAVLNKIGPETRKQISLIAQNALNAGNLEATYWSGRVQENFILARLYVQKFLVTNKNEDVERALENFSMLKKDTENLRVTINNQEMQKLLEEITGELAIYQNAFEDVTKHVTSRNNIIKNKLDIIGPEVAATIEELKLNVKDEQDTLGPLAVSRMESATSQEFTLAIGGLVLAIAAAFVIARSIVEPVRRMTNAMLSLAKGDLETEIPATEFKNEVGEMAKTVQIFKENAIKRQELEVQSREANTLRANRQDRIDQLIANFRQEAQDLLGSVSVNMTDMHNTASNLVQIAEQTSIQTGASSSASDNASSNVQTVAAASEQLNSSIREISEQVSRAMEIVGKATSTAQSTNTQVAALNNAAQKIGTVVNLISDIAEQTNLLALNATIEAARAGDAGRGFAVVATEVKQLAEQTAKATGEINSQIIDIQTSTEEAVGSIKEITETISEVNVYTTNIATAIEEQDAATNEISRSAQHASDSTAQVSNNIRDVQQAVGKTKQSANDMRSAAHATAQKSDMLKGVVDRFLADVAAA